MRKLYLCLAVIGAIVPGIAFIPWFLEHGFAISLFIDELFATRISSFFGLDVLISAGT